MPHHFLKYETWLQCWLWGHQPSASVLQEITKFFPCHPSFPLNKNLLTYRSNKTLIVRVCVPYVLGTHLIIHLSVFLVEEEYHERSAGWNLVKRIWTLKQDQCCLNPISDLYWLPTMAEPWKLSGPLWPSRLVVKRMPYAYSRSSVNIRSPFLLPSEKI